MNDLVVEKLDIANIALREAKTVQETKKIVDVAHAAEVYAKRQKLGEEAVNYAYSIKIEALKKLGEILRDTPRNEGAKGIGPIAVTDGNRNQNPTLADLGLSKKESSIAQKLASLPADQFEAVKAGTESMTKAIREVEEAKPEKIKVGAPSDGMQFARMAIMDLEQIRDDDTQRKKAFNHVKGWIQEHE
jgi:hypothetical protein